MQNHIVLLIFCLLPQYVNNSSIRVAVTHQSRTTFKCGVWWWPCKYVSISKPLGVWLCHLTIRLVGHSRGKRASKPEFLLPPLALLSFLLPFLIPFLHIFLLPSSSPSYQFWQHSLPKWCLSREYFDHILCLCIIWFPYLWPLAILYIVWPFSS